MNSTTRRRVNAERKAEYHFTNLIVEAKPLPTWEGRVEQASVWYPDEYTYCTGVARSADIGVREVAAYYAATSPRQRLAQNKVLTLQAALNWGKVEALPNVVETCARIYAYACANKDPVDAVSGRKTRNFALALLGDPEAVVVDVWMMRAAGWPDRDAPTKIQYDAIERVIRRMAGKMGLEPRTLQALIWIIKRGGAA